MKLDEADLRVSGFMEKIALPTDLPIGTSAKVAGYDERGLIIEKL